MGLLPLQEDSHLLRVSGHSAGVSRAGESIPDVPQSLRIIIHDENAGPGDSHGPIGHRKSEREPGAQAHTRAFGTDPAPMGLHDPPADGHAGRHAGPHSISSWTGCCVAAGLWTSSARKYKEYALNPYCPACARDLVDCLSEKMFAGSKCKAEMEVEADE